MGKGNNSYKSIFSRNLGFFTESEQEKLRSSTIGIAGVGGVGGLLAERLIRIGLGGLKILDPGNFEYSNFNRQFHSCMSTIGQNKAEAISKYLKDINPQADLYLRNTGVRTQKDAELFVKGCDVVVDAMDFGLFREAIYLQRAARRKGIHYIFASAIGFGALVVIFNPEGMTLEEYNRLSPEIDLETNEEPQVTIETICPIIPSYAANLSDDAETITKEIISGERPASTNSIGVGLASILTSMEAINILLRKRAIPSAPEYTYVDLIDRKFLVDTVVH